MGYILPITLLILSYLLGSIPWALIISKSVKGIDIREYGSKNMGATNVIRVVGKKWGILVFFLDALKAGIIILLFTLNIFDWQGEAFAIKIHPLFYGVSAYLGHLFPCFAGFKGGKGVSCAAGIALCYSPLIGLCGLILFLLIVYFTNYVSIGSCSCITFVTIAILVEGIWTHSIDWFFFCIALFIGIFMYIKHIPNFKRLLSGTENKTYLFSKQKEEKKSK